MGRTSDTPSKCLVAIVTLLALQLALTTNQVLVTGPAKLGALAVLVGLVLGEIAAARRAATIVRSRAASWMRGTRSEI